MEDTSQESSAKSYERRRLRLAQQLLEARTSQAELAKLAQVTVFTVNRCLTGKRVVKESTLCKLEGAMSDIIAGQRRTKTLNEQRRQGELTGQAGFFFPAMLAGGGLGTLGSRAGSLSDSTASTTPTPTHDANQEVRELREKNASQAEYIEALEKMIVLYRESNDTLHELVAKLQEWAALDEEEAQINAATIEGFLALRQKDPATTKK